MAESKSSTTVSFPVIGILGIVFVTLKLCGVINWSWWLVTLPFWGGLALALIFLLIGVVAAALTVASDTAKRKKRRSF